MSKSFYMRRYNAEGVLGFNGPIFCDSAAKAIQLALEIPKARAGDMLRVFARTKSGQWVEIAEFTAETDGRYVWWQEPAQEIAELINAICAERG